MEGYSQDPVLEDLGEIHPADYEPTISDSVEKYKTQFIMAHALLKQGKLTETHYLVFVWLIITRSYLQGL
jgi:hypothetical protein